jgi:phosphoribosylglycinamide formyltransferase-1
VLPGDDVDALEARIHEVEHEIYPTVLRAIAEGRMTMDGQRIVRISE